MSDNLSSKNVWIVGAGPMAVNHAKVLKHNDINQTVIGRGENSAEKFQEATGIKVHTGGIDAYLNKQKPDADTYIIIATGTEALMPTLLKFKNLTFGRILIEKPAAISIEELLENESNLEAVQDKVFVAYNRRFYPSVKKALELIAEDGGLQSMHFEFTEWAHKIEPIEKAPGVKENWFYANSTHVADLAFFIGGKPTEWNTYSKSGNLSWHDKSYFVGSGFTEQDVLFTYHSNWESAGNWNIELLTRKRKIILSPLEQIKIQNRGEIKQNSLEIEDSSGLKPGLNMQLKAFLGTDEDHELPTLKEHMANSADIFSKMLEK